MYPSPHGYPYPPYGMPPLPPPAPSTAFALTGGIIGIIVATMYLFIAMFVALVGGFFSALFPGSGDTVMLVAAVAGLVSVIAIVTGAFTCAAKPIWTAVNGGLHVCFALMWLYPLFDTGAMGGLFFTCLSAASAIFSFVGIPQARVAQDFHRRQRLPRY